MSAVVLNHKAISPGPDHSEPAFLGVDPTLKQGFEDIEAEATRNVHNMIQSLFNEFGPENVRIAPIPAEDLRKAFVTGYIFDDGSEWVAELYSDGEFEVQLNGFDQADHAVQWLTTHGAIDIRYAKSQPTDVQEACASMYADVFSLPNVIIEYTNRDGREVRWNTLSGWYFVVFDCLPRGANVCLRLEIGTTSIEHQTLYGAKSMLFNLRGAYREYDWSKTNARIMKAPCAFDAHEFGIPMYVDGKHAEPRKRKPDAHLGACASVFLLAVFSTLSLFGQAVQPPAPPQMTGHVQSEIRLHRIYAQYVIDADGMQYTVEQLLTPLKAPAHITVGADVKFSIVTNKMHFSDNDGKEHVATIIHQEILADRKGGSTTGESSF